MNKEIREIVRELQRRGYTVAIGGKHLKVKDELGRTVYALPTTPGGARWKQNLLSDLRRKGLL